MCRNTRVILMIAVAFVALADRSAAQSASEAALISAPPIKIPDAAYDAGIAGKLVIAIAVDKSGAVLSAKVTGGPMWPCDSDPDEAIKALKNAVVESMLAAKFSPAVKGGSPASSDILLSYTIRPRTPSSGSASPRVINAGVINGKAKKLVKPVYPPAARNSGASGAVMVDVTIDEAGNVEKAGALTGNSLLFGTSRVAACDSKFEPTLVQGTPVKVVGSITYAFIR